jgi:DNA polymerase I
MSARRQDLFPSLAGQGMISLDVETFDPNLRDEGPGWHRDGFIAGIAIGSEKGFRQYYPIGHEAGDNFDRERVLSWLRVQLANPKVAKTGANIGYDLGFLAAAGVEVPGPLYDVQIAEPLIDETRRSYSLESIAQSYFKEGKVDDQLEDFITTNLKDEKGRRYNGRNWKSGIWRAPANLVAVYAAGDVDLPLRIFAKQKPELERLGLWRLFELEISLIPMLLAMRQRGVAVDLEYAASLYKKFSRRQAAIHKKIRDAAGGLDFMPWNATSLGAVLDALEVPYSRTSINKSPSITKE